MNLSRRDVLVALTALPLLAACSGPAAEQARSTGGATGAGTLRLGVLNTRNTLTLAADSGLVAEQVAQVGGTVTTNPPFPAFAPAAEAMGAGRIDLTTGSTTALVAALQGNTQLAAFAVEIGDDDTQGIVATAASGITDLAGLQGRRVAVNQGGTGDYLLRMAIEAHDLRDVTPVHLSPPDAASAFAAGQVDAWATWDQYLASAQLAGGRVLALAKDLGVRNHTVHVVDRRFAQAHPALVVAVYDALAEQAQRVRQDPGLLERAYVDAGAPARVAELVAAKTPPTIQPADAAFVDELAAAADFYVRHGLTPTRSDVSGAAIDVAQLR